MDSKRKRGEKQLTLTETLEKSINNNYKVASLEIGISELILKEYIQGNAKLNIFDTEKILNTLNIKINNKDSKKYTQLAQYTDNKENAKAYRDIVNYLEEKLEE